MGEKLTSKQLHILVQLPLKLGDTIMATSFLRALKVQFPQSTVDVIIEKNVLDLKAFMPDINDCIPFSKKEYPGVLGKYKFGKLVKARKKYDLYFCLPSSFSSAMIGFFIGAKIRVGHNTEMRGLFLTHKYPLPQDFHVVDDYRNLLIQYVDEDIQFDMPFLSVEHEIGLPLPDKYIIVNACSGPPSRYIPIEKTVDIIHELKNIYDGEIVLTGAPSEANYIGQIEEKCQVGVVNMAGETSILGLGHVIKNAQAMITTDSGNAHFANAFGTPTVVLFGPGLQSRCQPFNTNIIRSHQRLDMECVPCRSETCKFQDNRCLTEIPTKNIIDSLNELISS